MVTRRMFPISDGPNIPWDMIAPYEAACKKQHSNSTLEEMARRGGLGCFEAVCIIDNLPWHVQSKHDDDPNWWKNRLEKMRERWMLIDQSDNVEMLRSRVQELQILNNELNAKLSRSTDHIVIPLTVMDALPAFSKLITELGDRIHDLVTQMAATNDFSSRMMSWVVQERQRSANLQQQLDIYEEQTATFGSSARA